MSSTTQNFAIGIDLGATKIASVIIAEDGQVFASAQVATEATDGMAAVMDRLADQIQELLPQAPGQVVGVGIGSPGKVDSNQGIVYDAVNLGWKEVHIVEEINNRM